MLPSVPLPLCHGPCPVLHSCYCCGGFTCCDVPSTFPVLLVSHYTFRVLVSLVPSSAVLGPMLRVRSRAGLRPCCAFGIVLHSTRAMPSKSRTQCYSSRIVSRLGLFVRRYSSHLLLYSFGPTCFARVSSVILRIAGCRSECGEALRSQEGPYDNTCNHDDSRRQGTSISDISSSTTSISGGDPDKRRDYNPSTHRYPLHTRKPKTPGPKSPTDHTCQTLHSRASLLVEGFTTKGGTITPPHIVNPSTHENPGLLHSRSQLKGLTRIPPGGIIRRVGPLKAL